MYSPDLTPVDAFLFQRIKKSYERNSERNAWGGTGVHFWRDKNTIDISARSVTPPQQLPACDQHWSHLEAKIPHQLFCPKLYPSKTLPTTENHSGAGHVI
ncbi:hypothetical protein TNCV_5132531 [Trichonephila clavipes]|nr:hypothetical protein TNCV_5132531 [Trichonephila clavipes]